MGVAGPDEVRTTPARGSTHEVRSELQDTATLSPERQGGMTRLYRVEPIKAGQFADWIHEARQKRGITEAEGRWFVQKPEMLGWYREDAGVPTKTTYIDLPTRDLEIYRVSNVTETIAGRTPASFSKDTDNEFFLPKDLAATRRLLSEPQAVSSEPVTARELSGSFEAKADETAPAVPAREHTLSPEQLRIARHVWASPDRVILIRGAAGTGKTHTMRHVIDRIDRPVVVLAPSADASRGVLRKEGFAEADTVARFLLDEAFQQQARNGVIWVDEAGLLGMRQVRQVFDAAEALNARVVLQGDKRQHGSIERGTTLRVLERYAGLPVAQLTDIRRQRGQYKAAVTALSLGDMLAGYDALADLGWVRQTPDNAPLVDEYMAAVDTKTRRPGHHRPGAGHCPDPCRGRGSHGGDPGAAPGTGRRRQRRT